MDKSMRDLLRERERDKGLDPDRKQPSQIEKNLEAMGISPIFDPTARPNASSSSSAATSASSAMTTMAAAPVAATTASATASMGTGASTGGYVVIPPPISAA